VVRSLRNAFIGVVSIAIFTGATGPAQAQPSGGAVAPSTGSAPVESVQTVTLITGDVVRLSTLADGKQVATVDQTGLAARHGFAFSQRNGDVYVVPHEAQPYITAGRLDEALFDVTELVRDGFHDAARGTLPLLITGTSATVAPSLTLRGAIRRTELHSIGAVAVEENKAQARDFWDALTAGPTTLAADTRKVWLDRKVHATLSDSVPQIGAPTAWRSGYDGKGVKVAVLDSGYDPTHPDLKGKVSGAANFTDEADTVDHFGHGTHVAATIAGSGTAGPAGGKGVAPGAQLLVGKVLNEYGTGDLSWVIAGMEWAVSQGARVINLSIGAQAAEGPDPATEAVDALTASSGALFVVAAGNSGPDIQTVTTPGTASSALTVGAVSKKDELASFSGRGPRLGDGVVKPEITAPGVGIVAARAAGTALGEIVDGSYISMSGTSMATPHVAGAAALIAQKHPDWKADQLKSALVASATPVKNAALWAQGAGRVDVPAALDEPVRVEPATISFGKIAAGSASPTTTVMYRNPGTKPISLTLSVEAQDTGATQRPAAVTISPTRLTVPAGGQATATVRLDATATAANMYAGLVTAHAAGGQQLRTPLGFNLTAPVRRLSVSAVNHDGSAPAGFSYAELWNLDSGDTYYAHFWGNTQTSVEVPEGRYALMGTLYALDEAGYEREATAITDPELRVTGDQTARFDGRTATELRVDTRERATPANFAVVWQRTTATRSIVEGTGFGSEFIKKVYAMQSRAASVGTFKFLSVWNLAAPALTAEVTGTSGFQLADPRKLENSPLLDGQESLPLVDGGTGTPAQLASAKGAAVLLRFAEDATPERLKAASAAGARLVLLAADQPGYYFANGDGSSVPVYAIDYADAQRLRQRLATGRATLALNGVVESPFRYDLVLAETGKVPADLHYTERDLALATVDSEFHGHTSPMSATDERGGFVAGIDVALGFGRRVTRAARRTDYVNTNGVTWRHEAAQEVDQGFGTQGSMSALSRTYKAGEHAREVWFPALTRPALPGTTANYAYGAPVNRAHDAIRVAIPQYADGSTGQYGWLDYRSDQAQLTLRRADTVVGQTTLPYAQFTVPTASAQYRLTLDVARNRFTDNRVWWTTSTATSTTWTFRSATPKGDDPVVLPLLQIGYDIDTDLTNTVRADRPYPLVLHPGYQPGAKARGKIQVDVAISYDDGKHWRGVSARGSKDVTAMVPGAPAGATFATIRVTAHDRDGNQIEQTITRAWKVSR
jgi:subtilisin family serine protease